MVCLQDPLVQTIIDLYQKISSLENLNPSKQVDALFTQLVTTCIPPHPVDVTKLCSDIQHTRAKLINLCGKAEGLLEKHYATILGQFEKPLDHIELFPYYNNYLKLSKLEFELLTQHTSNSLNRIAFIGSGPLPLTSIVLATHHLTSSVFHNYDIDSSANEMASRLVEPQINLSDRMKFFTSDVMDLSESTLKSYDVVFLAALVGMVIEDKMIVVEHLAKNMAPGAILMLRSAHGARAFLYPVVDPRELRGFEVLSVFHPTDEVINSIVVARKCPVMVHHESQGFGSMMLCSKCAEVKGFSPMMEELAVEDHCC